MRRGALLAVGALLAALALLAAASPRAPETYAAPVPPEERARNAAVLAALASAGIERAWVDAQPARVLVVLEPPDTIAEEDALRYALGACAVIVPGAEELVAGTTTGARWRVAGADVRAYQAGAITQAELEARVAKGAR